MHKVQAKFFGMGAYNDFRVSIQVSIVPFKVVPFGVYTIGPALLSLLDASVDLPFHDAFQHHLKFKLNISDILESLCLWIFIFGNRSLEMTFLSVFA
jgi:hypothetical protein